MARASATQRGYNSRWRKARLTFLSKHPLCKMCGDAGRITAASLVDHIQPHRGDQALFWDTDNWQALCKPCHDSDKQKDERRGYSISIGVDGWPVDPLHPANAGPHNRHTNGKQ